MHCGRHRWHIKRCWLGWLVGAAWARGWLGATASGWVVPFLVPPLDLRPAFLLLTIQSSVPTPPLLICQVRQGGQLGATHSGCPSGWHRTVPHLHATTRFPICMPPHGCLVLAEASRRPNAHPALLVKWNVHKCKIGRRNIELLVWITEIPTPRTRHASAKTDIDRK